MSRYTFTFKKDDIFVEFITEDRDVVERQFQIWVADADEYAKNGSKPLKAKTVNSIEKEAQAPQQASQARQEPVAEPVLEQPVATSSSEVQPAPAQEATKPQEPIIEPSVQEPVFDKASSLLKTINTIQNEQQNPEAVVSQELSSETPVDFGAVLEEKIENPTFEPTKAKDPIFVNLINSKHTTDKFHYLMITAYYLSEFEKLDRFSLKQINSKLMQNLSEIIDHAMLQDAINQGFIEVIPDLTGMSEVAEYRLTRLGEEFFANRI